MKKSVKPHKYTQNHSLSPPDSNASIDKWASWLLYQRFHNRPPEERKQAVALLENIRDHIFNSAQLCPGYYVLDLGAGTGLLTLGAIARISPTGKIIAADISTDSLQACRQDVAQLQLQRTTIVEHITANGLSLPLQQEIFDAIVMRSVLIYITGKIQTLQECYRVLKFGGRLSLFEPINRNRSHNVNLTRLPSEIKARLAQAKRKQLPTNDPMLDFDVEDLTRYVKTAGFTNVCVEQDVVKDELPDLSAIERYFARKPAPGRLSPAEYYTQYLGESGFNEYRQCWIEALHNGPVYFQTPVIYLTAIKNR